MIHQHNNQGNFKEVEVSSKINYMKHASFLLGGILMVTAELFYRDALFEATHGFIKSL
jgi:hypothetical protein